jgi:ABC-2 type transport system ATP-binding protein
MYGDVVGINNVTVTVEPGIVGLLGPNGAGKSTLMRMMMGLVVPSGGTIRVLDENPIDNPGLLRAIGYVPESDAPWPDKTGREAAIFGARLAGVSASQASERVDALFQKLGLAEQGDKKVAAYSRGMRQKLKLAIALAHEPELLILDEPLLGTDPKARRDIIQLIRDQATQGRSILVSTHILPDLEAMTDRILLLNHGRLMAYGHVAEIRDLLDRYPRAVRVVTPQPRELLSEVSGWESVLSVEAEKDAVLIRTKQPQVFYQALQDLLVSKRIPFTSVTSPDENVEAVFRYLVG